MCTDQPIILISYGQIYQSMNRKHFPCENMHLHANVNLEFQSQKLKILKHPYKPCILTVASYRLNPWDLKKKQNWQTLAQFSVKTRETCHDKIKPLAVTGYHMLAWIYKVSWCYLHKSGKLFIRWTTFIGIILTFASWWNIWNLISWKLIIKQ